MSRRMELLEAELEAAERDSLKLRQQFIDKCNECEEIKSRIRAENQRQVVERFARKRRLAENGI